METAETNLFCLIMSKPAFASMRPTPASMAFRMHGPMKSMVLVSTPQKPRTAITIPL